MGIIDSALSGYLEAGQLVPNDFCQDSIFWESDGTADVVTKYCLTIVRNGIPVAARRAERRTLQYWLEHPRVVAAVQVATCKLDLTNRLKGLHCPARLATRVVARVSC